jgi:GWxTD domain-containing protein
MGASQPGLADAFFPATAPRFAADVSTHLNQDGSPSVHIEIQVPYSELEFVKLGARYGAAVEFVAKVRTGDREVAGDVWEQRFLVGTFAESKDTHTRIVTTRSFPVREGRYHVKVQVRDLNGGRVSAAEIALPVTGLSGSTLGLTDMLFGECGVDTSGAEAFLDNTSRRYAEDLGSFCVESAVLDLSGPMAGKQYRLGWRIKDESSLEVASAETVLVGESARRFRLRPPVANLFLGTYEIQLEVQEGKRRWAQSGSFEVEAVTTPVGAQWATLLEILEYMANPGDLAPLRKANTAEARAAAWKTFWSRRDPTPGTERNESLIEFMHRIRYANAQFQGIGPGWRTDQGHIYIKYGAPDQMEEIPASVTSYPTQIWHYYQLNRKYTFIDRDGFGHYVLVNETGP